MAYRRKVYEQIQAPWWASFAGAVVFLVVGVTDFLYDWVNRGDPIFPYLSIACAGVALYSGIKRKRMSTKS